MNRHTTGAHLVFAGVLLVALAPVLQGCSAEEEVVAPESLGPPVMVESVEVRTVVDRIRATGQITAKAEATIAAQVEGQVTEIHAREGQAVSEGEILLVINPERRKLEVANAQAQLAIARAELDVAARSYERTKLLSKGNVASEARVDEDRTRESLARSSLAGAEARLGLAQRTLEDATVRAPFAGLVSRRHVSVGEYLTPGTSLFHLVALDPIEVEFDLAEVDSARVGLGFPVEISVAPYPDEVFPAIVTMIAPTIDPRTRTLRVKAELPNADGRIRPGLFAHTDLGVSERPDAILVSEDAVIQRADGSVVFRLDSYGRADRRLVEVGLHLDGKVEIREGLEPTDVIVVRGQERLDDGVLVSVRRADGRPTDRPASNSGIVDEDLAAGSAP
jgi:membrane fusion protein (multidrug efflux system)